MANSGPKLSLDLTDSAMIIERCYRRMKLKKSLKLKLSKSTTSFAIVGETLAEMDKTSSFEKAQALVCTEPFNKALAVLVDVMPFHVFNSLKANQNQRLKMRRIIVSACIICRYPENVLYTEDTDEPQSWESNNCLLTALSFSKHLGNFLTTVAGTDVSYLRLEAVLLNLYFSLHLFLKSFERWQEEDKLRTMKTLEDSYIEGYTAYLASKSSVYFQGHDPLLLRSSEMQLSKVREMMSRLMGKGTAESRMEELSASIEASMPISGQIKAYEESMKQRKESEQKSIAANGATTTTSTPAKSSSSDVSTSPGTTAAAAAPTTSPTLPPQPHQHQHTPHQQHLQPLVLDPSNPTAMKYLDKLSQLTGVHQEQLVHEMTLDKFYRLPVDRPTPEDSNSSSSSGGSSSSSVGAMDTPSLALKLKKQLLVGLSDKLINSLKQSTIDSPTQIHVGDVIPVRFAPNTYEPLVEDSTPTSDEPFDPASIAVAAQSVPPIISAKVLAIHYTAEGDTIEGLDVEYIHENGIKEEKVAPSRIKLSTHSSVEPALFLSTLYDLCLQVLSFTPNRHDLVNSMFTAVDFKLLRQILRNNAANPVHDLLPVLQYIQRAIQELQSPGRIGATQQWIDNLAASFRVSGGESKTFQEVVPLLPGFFEKASDCIEDIQRDMANFYIATLVPTMQTRGAAFLSACFKQRLALRVVSLDATASLLLSQLSAATFPSVVADCVEAGVCSSAEEMTLASLLTGSSSSSSSSSRSSISGGKVGLFRKAVVARALLTLLQVPARLDSRQAARIVPETLHFDASRLAVIRDLIDKIALESCVVITSRQILSRYQVSFKDTEEVELQHRLDVLLTESDVNLSSITVEVLKYVKFAIYRTRESYASASNSANSSARGSPLPGASSVSPRPLPNAVALNYDLKELQERVEKTLSDVVAPGNPVLSLFTKRIYKILLRVMLGQSITEKLTQYSLHSKGQERNITQLLDSVVRLFTHNYNVHGELYGDILQQFITAQGIHGISATAAANQA